MQGIPTGWGGKRKQVVFFLMISTAVACSYDFGEIFLERWCRQRILELGQEENDVFFFFGDPPSCGWYDDFGEFFLGEMAADNGFLEDADNTMAQHSSERCFVSFFVSDDETQNPNRTRDRDRCLDAAKPRKPLGNFRGETSANSNGFNFRASNLMTSREVGFRNPPLTER